MFDCSSLPYDQAAVKVLNDEKCRNKNFTKEDGQEMIVKDTFLDILIVVSKAESLQNSMLIKKKIERMNLKRYFRLLTNTNELFS